MDSIRAALDAYDAWLGQHYAVLPSGLRRKREKIVLSPFAFLRGTCGRFAAGVPAPFPELLGRLTVPSCGDAPIEIFGTWRDAEGRLVWG